MTEYLPKILPTLTLYMGVLISTFSGYRIAMGIRYPQRSDDLLMGILLFASGIVMSTISLIVITLKIFQGL